MGVGAGALRRTDQLGRIPEIALPLVAFHQLANLSFEVAQHLEFGEQLARGIGESHGFVFAQDCGEEKYGAARTYPAAGKTKASHEKYVAGRYRANQVVQA
jgi:hypothetical protein